MIYSENLTNRELVMNAMPLVSLSREQWNSIIEHCEENEVTNGCDSILVIALKTMIVNQSRLEVMSNYFDYHLEDLDNQVCEKSARLFPVISA